MNLPIPSLFLRDILLHIYLSNVLARQFVCFYVSIGHNNRKYKEDFEKVGGTQDYFKLDSNMCLQMK